jgi:phenylacetate-CoA ligase
MDFESLYSRLPVPMQNAAISWEGRRIQRRRFGAAFQRTLAECQPRTFWNREQTEQYRDERLRQAVRRAAATTPYYRELFARLRLRPRDIRSLDDLRQLPILTKGEIQEQPQRFRAENVAPRDVLLHHTSGSTGAGLQFPATRAAEREQWAVWWRYRGWHGIALNEACLYFGGRSIVPLDQRKAPFWRYNRPSRQILFSGYHLSPETAPAYLDEMRRSGVRWLHGYPSLVSLIAQYALASGVRLRLSWITTGAESLLPHQARIIEDAFGVAPRQHYGMAEGVANISQCPDGKLHVDEDFSAVEFVPAADGVYRIVGSSFANPAFPLLRYDVGDLAVLSNDKCDCGRPGRVVREIDGRKEDFVITKSGAMLGRLDHIFKDCTNVAEAQIRQSERGRMTIHVATTKRYGVDDERRLAEEVRKRVGDDVDFEIVRVERIERTSRGKLRLVVSTLPSDANRAA